MVTGGGHGGLQQCGEGQGGIGGLRCGASRAEERQGEGEGKGGGYCRSPVEAERENEDGSGAQRREGGFGMGQVSGGGAGGRVRAASIGRAWQRRALVERRASRGVWQEEVEKL
jgi:hypothetical protein